MPRKKKVTRRPRKFTTEAEVKEPIPPELERADEETFKMEFKPSVRASVQTAALNRVNNECEDIEKAPRFELEALTKKLNFDLKQLRQQRANLFDTLAHNQAKTASPFLSGG